MRNFREAPLSLKLAAAGGILGLGLGASGCAAPAEKETIIGTSCNEGWRTKKMDGSIVLTAQANEGAIILRNYDGDPDINAATTLKWRIPGKEWHSSNPDNTGRETILYVNKGGPSIEFSLQEGAKYNTCVSPDNLKEELQETAMAVKNNRPAMTEVVFIKLSEGGKTYTETTYTKDSLTYLLITPVATSTHPA